MVWIKNRDKRDVVDNKRQITLEKHAVCLKWLPHLCFNINGEEGTGQRGKHDLDENMYLQTTLSSIWMKKTTVSL